MHRNAYHVLPTRPPASDAGTAHRTTQATISKATSAAADRRGGRRAVGRGFRYRRVSFRSAYPPHPIPDSSDRYRPLL